MDDTRDESVSSKPIRGRWLGLAGLVLVFAVLTFLFVASNGPEPTSNGMTVSAWLNSTNKSIRVEGFGPDAIPYFITEYRLACQPGSAWDGLKKLKIRLGFSTPPKADPDRIRRRALRALAMLGKEHAAQVDPFFMDVLESTNRLESISYLGLMGTRHFKLLTNMIAGANDKELGYAIWALMGMGATTLLPMSLVPSIGFFATRIKSAMISGCLLVIRVSVQALIFRAFESGCSNHPIRAGSVCSWYWPILLKIDRFPHAVDLDSDLPSMTFKMSGTADCALAADIADGSVSDEPVMDWIRKLFGRPLPKRPTPENAGGRLLSHWQFSARGIRRKRMPSICHCYRRAIVAKHCACWG